MTSDQKHQRNEFIAGLAARLTVTIAECDQTIRDIDAYAKAHDGEPGMDWVEDEKAQWIKMRNGCIAARRQLMDQMD